MRWWWSGGWMMALASALVSGLALSSCRELSAPDLGREGNELSFLGRVKVEFSNGRPVSHGELLFDNRQYVADPSDGVQFRISLDAEGRGEWVWIPGQMADLEITPADFEVPSYWVLGLNSDREFDEGEDAWVLVHDLRKAELDLGPALLSRFPAVRGEIDAWQGRRRPGELDPYSDHVVLSLDDRLVATGWIGPGLWRIQAAFYTAEGSRFGVDVADSSRLSVELFADAASQLRRVPATIVWPDSLPAPLTFKTTTSGSSADGRFDGLEVHEVWDSQTWPGALLLPSGSGMFWVDVPNVRGNDRFGPLGFEAGATSLATIHLKQYWMEISARGGWSPQSSLEARLRDSSFLWYEFPLDPDSTALVFVDAGSYRLELRDHEILVFDQIYQVDRNLRINIVPPASSPPLRHP